MTTATVLRRRGLLAAVLALALLLPWLQQGALQHAFGHALGHASNGFATAVTTIAHGPEGDGPAHADTCTSCVAFAAFLACPPAATALAAPLLATAGDRHVAPLPTPAATGPAASRNRGPPAAG